MIYFIYKYLLESFRVPGTGFENIIGTRYTGCSFLQVQLPVENREVRVKRMIYISALALFLLCSNSFLNVATLQCLTVGGCVRAGHHLQYTSYCCQHLFIEQMKTFLSHKQNGAQRQSLSVSACHISLLHDKKKLMQDTTDPRHSNSLHVMPHHTLQSREINTGSSVSLQGLTRKKFHSSSDSFFVTSLLPHLYVHDKNSNH